MKNKESPERNIEKYNYLKSIKDKEQIIIQYYNKINHLNTDKPKPLVKPKKRTRKNIHKEEAKEKDKEKDKDQEKEDKEDKEDKEKQKKEIEKKTKKNIVIMDD